MIGIDRTLVLFGAKKIAPRARYCGKKPTAPARYLLDHQGISVALEQAGADLVRHPGA